MYTLGIVLLLAVATVKLVDFLTDKIEALRPMKSLLTFVIAVGATVALDFSVFRAWGSGIDNETLGVWITGFAVAGMTSVVRAVLGYLTHDKAARDDTLGESHPLRRAA